jgi:hypothetical protein
MGRRHGMWRDLQPLRMLVEHRVDDVDEGLVAREEAVATGQQVALEPALAQVLAQHLHHAAVGRQMVVAGQYLGGPGAVAYLEHRAKPVRGGFVGPMMRKLLSDAFSAHHVAQELAHHARGLGVTAPGLAPTA